jgi:hypothetical protein
MAVCVPVLLCDLTHTHTHTHTHILKRECTDSAALCLSLVAHGGRAMHTTVCFIHEHWCA